MLILYNFRKVVKMNKNEKDERVVNYLYILLLLFKSKYVSI